MWRWRDFRFRPPSWMTSFLLPVQFSAQKAEMMPFKIVAGRGSLHLHDGEQYTCPILPMIYVLPFQLLCCAYYGYNVTNGHAIKDLTVYYWCIKIQQDTILVAQCKTAVKPLLAHWSYHSLALSHWYWIQHDNHDCSILTRNCHWAHLDS